MRIIIIRIEVIKSTSLKIQDNIILEITIMLRNVKVGLLPSEKKNFYLFQWKPFKNNEKCFLFHLINSFRSQDILILLCIFGRRKKALIRKIWATPKLMTSQLR